MLNQLETMFWEIPPNGNLNKLEFLFLPLSKGNTKAGSPVLVAWVLHAIGGLESFPSLMVHVGCSASPCIPTTLERKKGSKGTLWWLSLFPF